MKISWGYRIAILYVSFVGFMLFLVFKCSSEDFSLVTKDYYQKEIEYQQQINKEKNTDALAEKPKIEWLQSENKIRISFPESFEQHISGEILLYRPSDSKKDFKVPVQINAEHIQDIDFASSERGLWRVLVDYKVNGTEYFTEKPIIIQ